MKVVINVVPDIETIIVQRLKNHIYNEVHYIDIFPNFPGLRISGVHPFVFLIDHQLYGTKIPVDLFPSITLVDESDGKDTAANTPTVEGETKIYDAEIADIESDVDKLHYVISPTDFTALKALVVADTFPFAVSSVQRRRSSVVCEVWDNNVLVKNRLYDIARNFFVHKGRYDLYKNDTLLIEEESISGQKSGNYNFDFGSPIYGATMRFNLVYSMAQYVVDSSLLPITTINHSYKEVKDSE